MRPVDPRLLKYASAARSFFVAGGALAVLQTAAVVAFSFLVTQVVVGAIAGAPLGDVGLPLLLLAGVVLVRFMVSWTTDINAARGSAVVKSELRARVLDAVTRLGPGRLATRNSTSVAVTAGSGLDALDTYFAKYLPQLILTAIATPVLVVVIWWQDWISGLTVALTLPLIPVFMILIGWATQAVQQRQWQKLQRLSTAFLDVVGGLSTLKIYGRQHRQSARIRTVTEEYRGETMKVLRVSFLSGFALELAASLSVALVAVSIGVRLIDGSLGLGVGLFVLLLAPEAFLPLRNVGAQFHAAADGVAASTSVFELLDEAVALPLPAPAPAAQPGGLSLRNEGVSSRRAGAGVEPGGAPGENSFVSDGLQVRGLGVRYGDSVAFEGLDAAARAGAVTALAGPSGSGKSSFVAALLGFVPAEGRVLLNGHDVTDEPAPRAWLAWSGQRATLLSGTVASNVMLGDDAATATDAGVPDGTVARDGAALAAARAALDLVGGRSIRLDAAVDPRGGGLSGGQAQRVAAARAVYRARRLDREVIVFDEPTSALDDETEGEFIRSLRTLADEGRVVLVVSHRPAVLAAADDVIRFEARIAVAS
ncbi:thiol reductant ABC exporter subunit CydD [Herbiconiux sp.]|uniref:thiol reductant ABC exporter subunit CydD n=1 Tax=Herbiconiux sp. TaxID=1871186 RepID=UPI0025BA61EF|nr:thiol reductant ABC exporter subunit CydD [Herbiconiux sp.]